MFIRIYTAHSLVMATSCPFLQVRRVGDFHRGLAVTSRDNVIDGRPPYWRYFFRAAPDVLMESWQTAEDVMVLPCDFTAVCHDSKKKKKKIDLTKFFLISKKI
jgi:hypothetical protein